MPKRIVAVDYQTCDPKQCENGICKATLACPRRVLTQEAPFEMPDAQSSMCLSCAMCTLACPMGAVFVL